ncbi:hypothetical protein jhhlp_006912 [Lomentospora prolificans]|uniref:ATP-dependent DNA helicase II subunit 2 n=1 Tax=Lomentospora prolificans TaxID=41688 RepID=A0A2N3N321_9PEZI|nr:hypothetical protein jhhlp_006912 [Lomentospora prolificans]
MAEKEAIIFIIDVGSTMAECNSGRTESDLNWSMRFVWDKISHIVSLNLKGLCVGVVGLRTEETNNSMKDDEGYEHISVLQNLGPMDMASLRELQKKIKTSNESMGDALSAVAIATFMITEFTKKLKYNRQIYLITDGLGPIDMDDNDLRDISAELNDNGISLTVLGVDFDDADYGVKEEDKPKTKARNEKLLRRFAEMCNKGTFGTMAEAIDELDIPVIKATRPYKSFEGTLSLGNPENGSAAVVISVERYFKTHTAMPTPASTVVVKSEAAEPESMEGLEFGAVKQARTYKVNDPNAPGGKKDVEFESLAKGYGYGRTAVHISESEHNITKLETEKDFSILGFLEQDNYDPMINMGGCNVTYPRKFDTEAQVAFSSLIQAMHKAKAYAVARLVSKDGKEPLLVLLAPDIENNCLYDVPLPFAEDVRGYQFPPLDRVVTVSGATLKEHRFLPGKELEQAMSDYVDAMDLSAYAEDEDQNPIEYMTIDEPFNPIIHRIKQVVKERAVHPDAPIPPVPKILTKFSAPPEDVVENARQQIDTLIEAAEVKKVPPKAKGRRQKEAVKPLSGLDIDALLGPDEATESSERKPISASNAIPEFRRVLDSADQMRQIEDATKQMGQIIRDLISSDFGGSKDDRVLEHLGAMRDGLVNLEEPDLYNSFVKDLKKQMLSGALEGDRREMWWKIRKARLGLIDNKMSEVSEVTEEEAKEFYTSR